MTIGDIRGEASDCAPQNHCINVSVDYKWVRAFLLIAVMEGVVGKWIAPSLEYFPVLARDIVAIVIVWRAIASGRTGQYPDIFSGLTIWTIIVAIFSFIQALALGYGLTMILIGLRFWLMYFWVGFAICCTLSFVDFIRLGELLVKILWIMSPLILVQNQAGASAWINKGSVDDAYVFIVSGDVVRATGTFSFTLGFSCFLALVTPLLLGRNGLQSNRTIPWFLRPAPCYLLLVACSAMSGSRSVFVLSATLVCVNLLANILMGSAQSSAALVSVGIAAASLALLPILLPETVIATEERVTAANDAEDPVERIQYMFIGGPKVWRDLNLLGQGLGLSANMSAKIAGVASTGEFVLAEAEPERVLLAGGIVGLLLVGIKFLVLGRMFFKSVNSSVSNRTGFPMLTWVVAAIAIVSWPMSGQLAAQSIGTLALSFSWMSIGVYDRSRHF